MKILLEISYLGTGFSGYQVQPGKLTVQSALQDAIEAVYGCRYAVKGCSRTDAGVHALRFYATFETDKNIPCDRIPSALNSAIHPNISVLAAREVNDGFHVRHDVLWKEYEYVILARRSPDPFYAGRAWHFPKPLLDDGIERMQSAAKAFIGRHDFSGFMSAGSDIADTNRTVKHLEIISDGDFIRVRIAADGFLYNMVRIIVGTLLECATGKRDPDAMADIIASCDRSRSGMTAPPEGLYLRRVVFDEKMEEK